MLTLKQLQKDPDVRAYIEMEDTFLNSLGYTEHGFAHVTAVAEMAGMILKRLGYSEREVELGKIAGYLHDLGNIINRIDHAQSGAVMAFRLLDQRRMDPKEIAVIISAIGNHDEGTAYPVTPVAAALILADKSDVRRSRGRKESDVKTDIHDRVNYAVSRSEVHLDPEKRTYSLSLTIDTAISPVMDYFEIFLSRMLLCRKAAEALSLTFHLEINGQSMM